MGTNFTSGTEIKLADLVAGMKIYINQKWWTVNGISITGSDVALSLEAKFVGKVDITMPLASTVLAEKGNTMGHKHQHLLYNDSSQSAEQHDDKKPDDLDLGFGLGSG